MNRIKVVYEQKNIIIIIALLIKICTYIINDKLYLNNIVYIFSYSINLY